MEKKEIFRIFDACQPTVSQVKEYLKKMSAISPFELIFRKDGKEIFTHEISNDSGELIGVIVDKTIFYARTMTYKDAQALGDVDARAVFEFGKSIHSCALPINTEIFTLLKEHQDDFAELAEKLEVFGYPKIYQQETHLLFNCISDAQMASMHNFKHGFIGSCSIEFHLRMRGNIYFYASIQ